MPKALKRSHEEELHQIRMQLQAFEEETERVKAARENFVFEQLDREAARAEQEETAVSQRKLEVNNLQSLIAERKFTAEVICEVYEETRKLREVAEEEAKRKHELQMQDINRKHEMQMHKMHAQRELRMQEIKTTRNIQIELHRLRKRNIMGQKEVIFYAICAFEEMELPNLF